MAFILFNLAAVAALVGIDQLIKLWAVQALQPVGAMPFIPHVVVTLLAKLSSSSL